MSKRIVTPTGRLTDEELEALTESLLEEADGSYIRPSREEREEGYTPKEKSRKRKEEKAQAYEE